VGGESELDGLEPRKRIQRYNVGAGLDLGKDGLPVALETLEGPLRGFERRDPTGEKITLQACEQRVAIPAKRLRIQRWQRQWPEIGREEKNGQAEA